MTLILMNEKNGSIYNFYLFEHGPAVSNLILKDGFN